MSKRWQRPFCASMHGRCIRTSCSAHANILFALGRDRMSKAGRYPALRRYRPLADMEPRRTSCSAAIWNLFYVIFGVSSAMCMDALVADAFGTSVSRVCRHASCMRPAMPWMAWSGTIQRFADTGCSSRYCGRSPVRSHVVCSLPMVFFKAKYQ